MSRSTGDRTTSYVVLSLVCLLVASPAEAWPGTTKGVAEAVRAAVATQYQVPLSDVDVRGLLPDLETAAGRLPETAKVLRAGPIRQLGPSVSVRVELQLGEERKQKAVVLRYALEAWRVIPVASRAMSKGLVLGSSELELRRMPLSHTPMDAMQEMGVLMGARLLRPVASGSALVPGAVDLPPVMRQGAAVRVLVRSGGVEVLGQATALQDGRVGQFIRVLNVTSRKDFLARVRDAEVVEIDLGEVEE